MIQQLAIVRKLIEAPVKRRILLAVMGSSFIAGLDMLGVAAMLPLMQLITGADPEAGAVGFIAELIGTHDTQTLILTVSLIIGLAFAVKSAATVAFRWWLLGHTTRLEAEAATEVMRRYILAPYWAHREREISVIHRNISTAVGLTFGQVVLGLVGIIADVLTLLAIAIVLLIISPLATIFAVILFGTLGWVVQWSLKKRHLQVGKAITQADMEAWAALMPGLSGFREARLFARAELFVGRFRKARVARAHANRVASLVSEVPKYILELGFVVGIACIAVLLFSTGTPESALWTLGVFAAAATRLLPTMNRIVATIGSIRAGRIGLEILAREVTELDAAGYHSDVAPGDEGYSGNIILSEVTYRYRDSADNVLRGVSAVIEEGKTTAFVGSSGAGKSTLVDIILGLLEPTSGSVRCGGRSVFEDLPAWYQRIGVVPQDVYLLDEDLKYNITFGQDESEIDAERLDEAISLAQLSSFVSDLPEGLKTRLGERGVRLSGGQRQRVGIARALYRRPDMLVLDEATSALDNVTEKKIAETIHSLSGNVTILLVAHRLSTVKSADKIIFFSGGKIAGEGTFSELERSCREFAHLVAIGKLG